MVGARRTAPEEGEHTELLIWLVGLYAISEKQSSLLCYAHCCDPEHAYASFGSGWGGAGAGLAR